MKPVAIFQHDPLQRPGYLLEFLDEEGIASHVFDVSADGMPSLQARDFSGLVFLGSDHSVNDRLPWIARELALVEGAIECDVPVLGHCFGGQLLARALGAPVHANPFAHIGWSRLHVTPDAKAIFGPMKDVVAFNWHYESFAIPRGATRTLFGVHCLNKGFALGKHMAFQCHLEVTEAIVRGWCDAHRAELGVAQGPAVQSEAQILALLPERLACVHQAARVAYRRWTAPMIESPCARRHVHSRHAAL